MSMSYEKINKVLIELTRVSDAVAELRTNGVIYGEHGNAARVMYRGSSYTAKLKRASLDATRALAEMRKVVK